MGLFDLPSPLLNFLDEHLFGFLPPVVRILIWAAIGALVSMELYRALSPQAKVAELKVSLLHAQQRVSDFDGEFNEAWPLLGNMLSLALQRIVVVLPSTLIASLPLLIMVVWLDGAYGYSFPPAGQAVQVEAPAPFTGKWVGAESGQKPHAQILDDKGQVVVDAPVKAAVPVLQKWHWWNVLLGNPAGYLASSAPIETLTIDLPEKQIVAAGPAWLRGWAPSFFLAVLLIAMTLKWARQIQ
jgi:hypothetical protein